LAFDLVLSNIEATCTCPVYGRGTLCHHIWATILGSDEAGWLWEHLPLLESLTVSHQHEDRAFPEPGASEGRTRLHARFATLRQVERGRVIPFPRRPQRSPQAPKPPTWQEQLQRIIRRTIHLHRPTGAPSPMLPRPRRAWYIWNIDRSLEVGGLVLEFYHQERRQNGTFGSIKAQGVTRGEVGAYEDPADQRLLQLLLGHAAYEDKAALASPYGHRDMPRQRSCVVAPVLYNLLLPELCATERLLWVQGESALDETHRVAWDGGPPCQFKLAAYANAER
jgi:hypothetical protein